ncbi:TraB/GumN family protein [Dongia sedimenti]|uniref:TraB/GumN family protein n=1 Tax=Dongia sedimenti TaxID=3064282 RepID=A0ABU0YFW1_9PROT|nr:TraB/GumN family protein [Rhodospirillaceae bacterium R-7]
MLLSRPIHAALRALSVTFGLLCGAGTAAADPAMWVVKDADSTVYLLGTIHVLKPGVNWRSAKLDAALKSSDEYWMEADIEADPAIAQTYAINFGMDSRRTLAEAVGEANFAKFVALAKRYQIPTEQLHRMRPWLAAMVLTRAQVMGTGYDPELGVDRTLEREALAAGKPIKPFETASEQLGYLADMPDKVAAEMLVQSLDEVEEGMKLVDALETAWLAGDVKQLQRIGPDKMRKEAPELFDAILARRNANWVKQIDAMLKGSGTQFIAVGAAHLVGKDSVPDRLGKLGYKVERY